MSDNYGVRDCFSLPPENHGHPGSISRVIMGPNVKNKERPQALNAERLIIHTNEYEVDGYSGTGHAHDNQEQAFYILEGKIEVDVGEETYQLGPGDCVLLPRNVFHKHRNIGDTPLKFLFISVILD